MEQFKWTEFYSEFADSLLQYADKRDDLINKVKEIYIRANMKLPTLEKDNNIVDIDPFTVFALFNKNIKDESRIILLKQIKDIFGISAEVPQSFDGIPIVDPRSATFYYFIGKREKTDIENLWRLFKAAIEYSDTKENKSEFIDAFNSAISQKGVSWNITMGLYWIRPFTFINLDSCNRKFFENNKGRFMPELNITNLFRTPVSAEDYLQFMEKVKVVIKEYDGFPHLSYSAWMMSKEDHDAFYGEKYWPLLEEFNPNLSKDDWKKYICEVEMPFHPAPMQMLKAMMELGGEATCKKLSDEYGGHVSAYVGDAVNLGKRVKKYFNLPSCMDDEQERFFPFPFLGRKVFEDGTKCYSYKIRPELYAALKEIDLSGISPYYEGCEEEMTGTDVNKNTILYGPPGTGKTYNTVNYAVAIIENKPLADVEIEDYADVLKRYNEYKEDGLIEFTTFHQSYGYEEFIEGIKPVMDSEADEPSDIRYAIEDGLFKDFCNKASLPAVKETKRDFGLNKNPTIWKVSLWSTGDNPTRTECLENGHIRIGWDAYGAEITENTDFSEMGGKKVLNAFISRMKIGDIVFSCYSSTTIDAIGVVTGDYEWCGEQYDDGLNRRRKVNWIVKGINEDILDINGGVSMTLSAVYNLKNITISDAMAIIEKHLPGSAADNKNRVFIIDEINRGNISKIFGELITLIEPTKRLGQDEELKTKLPYSQKPFGVPDNVYIIGTMNTADRSIATIDTALRRRFYFKEMMPDANVLADVKVRDLSISEMLENMNKKIAVLYDREHTIGHSYFLPLKKDSTIDKLAEIFENEIIPLLQEYFYEDYEKISLVLGDNKKENLEDRFIVKTENDFEELFGNAERDFDVADTYEINKKAFNKIEAYKYI